MGQAEYDWGCPTVFADGNEKGGCDEHPPGNQPVPGRPGRRRDKHSLDNGRSLGPYERKFYSTDIGAICVARGYGRHRRNRCHGDAVVLGWRRGGTIFSR